MFGWKPTLINVCDYLLTNKEFLVMPDSKYINSIYARGVYVNSIRQLMQKWGILNKEMEFQLNINVNKKYVEELIGILSALKTLGIVEQHPWVYQHDKEGFYHLYAFTVINETKLRQYRSKLIKS